MQHIISYSGGLGSAITAEAICSIYGPDNVTLLFADTLVEDADLYRFNREFVAKLNCHFARISDGRTPWQVFEDVGYIGNTRIDPCSQYLKRALIKRYLKKFYKPDECIVWIGIDCTEEHRLAPVVKKNLPYTYRSYLIENNIFLTNSYKKDWCERIGIEAPRLYKFGFAHNNCGGFCVKAGLGQFKKLYEFLPEVYMQNELEEQRVMQNNPKLKPFLRKTINGKLTYITLRDYRINYLESGNISQDESLQFGGCGCAL